MSEKKLKFWGWGYAGEGATPAERRALADTYGRLLGLAEFPDPAPPAAADFALPKPRIAPPPRLARLFRSDAETRLVHALGKSFPDAVRMADRKLGAVPDLVAFPATERDIAAILDWAAARRVAVIPFGGGTSVVGGVEAEVGDRFRGVVTLSTVNLSRVREIDPVSRAALIEGGIRGPALEAALAPHGLTLRHFPQSFEMATLGGWIATRSGGHYATLYTHIDDFVESLRLATPAGVSESRRLPGSGAGPSPDRLAIGSEGALGVITAAWMRLQHRPRFRANAAATFASFLQGAEAVRAIAQSGLNPANCRLVDADECRVNGVSADGRHLLVLGFESAHVDVAPAMARAVELVRAAGGTVDTAGHTEGAVGRWRNAFLRMPYFREITVNWAVINDTFETAIPWNRFPDFHAAVMEATARAIRAATGAPGLVTCRFTHVYPDGPAPYYSFHAKGDRRRLLAQWRRIKKAASDAVIAHGGTITHHHAVGRDHMPWYERQRPRLFGAALEAAKRALDPAGIMNPGVIVR
jgi:alkyldihydroxyacetonephosphate synthase